MIASPRVSGTSTTTCWRVVDSCLASSGSVVCASRTEMCRPSMAIDATCAPTHPKDGDPFALSEEQTMLWSVQVRVWRVCREEPDLAPLAPEHVVPQTLGLVRQQIVLEGVQTQPRALAHLLVQLA